jgi:DNA-binding HxlR family transcriptional regulator
MTGYGQFCSVARAHEVLGGRWTLLVVRELLCGERRFNDIRRGIPRISRTMLSERLQALADVGVVLRVSGPRGPEHVLTEAPCDGVAVELVGGEVCCDPAPRVEWSCSASIISMRPKIVISTK